MKVPIAGTLWGAIFCPLRFLPYDSIETVYRVLTFAYNISNT